MASAHRARQPEDDTAFHRRRVRPQDRSLDTEAGSSPERDNHENESPPPARVLPAGGTYTARQPRPHIDAPGELAVRMFLVPKSLSKAHRCCHRPPRNPDSGKETLCNQDGEYAEWTLAEVETHRKVRLCKICFTTGFEDTLTPEGVYAESETSTKMCPYCAQTIPSDQHAAHTKMCAELEKEVGLV